MTVKDVLSLDSGIIVKDFEVVFSQISVFKKTTTGKLRQSATLKDSTGEIPLVIWGGNIDKFLYGSTFIVKSATVDEYNGKKRLQSKMEDIVLTGKKSGYVKQEHKEEPAPEPKKQTATEVLTGSPEKPVVPLTVQPVTTDREETKSVMKECLEDALELTKELGLPAENLTAIINTLFIERSKRIRGDKY